MKRPLVIVLAGLAVAGCSSPASSPATVTVTATSTSTTTAPPTTVAAPTSTPDETTSTVVARSSAARAITPPPVATATVTATVTASATGTGGAAGDPGEADPTLAATPTETSPDRGEITGMVGDTLKSPTGNTVRATIDGKATTYDGLPCTWVTLKLTNHGKEIMNATGARPEVYDTQSNPLQLGTVSGNYGTDGSARVHPGQSTSVTQCYVTQGHGVGEITMTGDLATYVWKAR